MVHWIIKIAILISIIFHSYAKAQEFLWAGANQYQLWFQEESRIQQQLNAMQYAGLTVLRIFLGERPYQSWEDPPDAYTFEGPLGIYHDENLEKVDYLMSECKERDIKLIIALNNHSDIYFQTYGAKGMYSHDDALQAYKNRFEYFLNHHNSYLDKSWKDCDDVVYAWEIQNEPGVPLLNENTLSSTERHDLIRNFLSIMATHLKSLDPNTKVALGIAGYANYYHSGKSGDDIRTLGNIQDADIYTLHFYGGNLETWIDDNLPYCRSINKLLFIEEFGDQRKAGMSALTDKYEYVTQTCREKGAPWMFWRLGHRKDDNTWSINSDDGVWLQIVVPEAGRINQTMTSDLWGINPASNVHRIAQAEKKFQLINCYPNPFNKDVAIQISGIENNINLKIYSISGEIVFEKNIQTDGTTAVIHWDATNVLGSEVASGLYFVTVRSEQDILTRKICLAK